MALNLGPTPERSRTPAILTASVILVIVAALVYHFSPHTPAQISVVKTDLYAPHTETKEAKGGVHVLGTPTYAEDNLYVVLHVRIMNKLKIPIYLNEPDATLVTPDGATPATVVNPADVIRLELAFPAVTALATNPLGGESEVAPGATADGSIVLLFPTLNEAAWKSKKSATLTLNLRNLPAQTITLP